MFNWESIGLKTDLVLLIASCVILLLLILVIVLFVKLGGMKKRMQSFTAGSDGKSLEQSFREKFENMDFINEKLTEIDRRLDGIDRNLLITFQKYSVIKYDAFDSAGGQLSFVVCMLNKDNNGFIMNTVHSNSAEGYFAYLKEVKDGRALLELSDEEEIALERALG